MYTVTVMEPTKRAELHNSLCKYKCSCSALLPDTSDWGQQGK